MDVISREDALMCATGEIKQDMTAEEALMIVAKRLRKLPTLDHPHIIQCKDCKHCWDLGGETGNNLWCKRTYKIFPVKSDDFCSWAEKKEGFEG